MTHSAKPYSTPIAWLLLLTAGSGAAALGHQMVWLRRIIDVAGAHHNTFATVTGAFFLGLAAGAWLATRWQAPIARHWQHVAAAEIGIGLLALPILIVAALSPDIIANVPASARLFVPFLFVAPPAMAMGLILPWLLHAMNQEDWLTPSRTVLIYALNTLGGAVGILAALGFLLPRWGIHTTGICLAALNLVIAGGLYAIGIHSGSNAHSQGASGNSSMSASEPSTSLTNSPPASASPLNTPPLRMIAFASGFLVLAQEVLFQMQFLQISINSLFSSSGVLWMVLLALAVGPLLLVGLRRYLPSPESLLPIALLLSTIGCCTQPLLHQFFGNGLGVIPYELSPGPYFLHLFARGFVTLLPALLPASLIFPLLLQQGQEFARTGNAFTSLRGRSQSRSSSIAALLMWNGIGGWLGAEFANRVLLPYFGLWTSLPILALGYFGLLTCTVIQPTLHGKPGPWQAAIFAAAGCIVLTALLVYPLPNVGLAEETRIIAIEAGREGVVAAVQTTPRDRWIVQNNTYTLGGSTAQPHQERQAHLPMIFHGAPKSVATLGVATGSTVAGALLHPTVERVDAIELSPIVLKFAEKHFKPYNRAAFDDPRLHIHIDDARWIMMRHRNSYDVILGDLFLPWRNGEGRLFSKEHFQSVHDALKPQGVFCQWLPLFQLTQTQFDSILHTFQTVFPSVWVLRGDFFVENPIVGLIGTRSDFNLDWQRMEAACQRLHESQNVTDPIVRHIDGFTLMLIGNIQEPHAGNLNTLANGWLEMDAGRNILGLREPWFVGVPMATWIRDLQRKSHATFPIARQKAHEAGRFYMTIEVANVIQSPELPALKEQMNRWLPRNMATDRNAEWRKWPGRVKPDPTTFPNRSATP